MIPEQPTHVYAYTLAPHKFSSHQKIDLYPPQKKKPQIFQITKEVDEFP